MSKYERIPFEDIPFNAETPKSEGFLNQAKALGVRGLQAPFKIGETVGDVAEFGAEKILGSVDKSQIKNPFTGDPLKVNMEPTPRVSEKIGELFGGEEALKPSNIVAEGLQSTAGSWPLLFVGGGSLLPKLAADLAGSYGMAGAKKAGFGTMGQLGAGILSHAGFSGIINSLTKTLKGGGASPSKVGSFVENLYKNEKKLGQSVSVNPEPLRKELASVYDDVQKKLVSTRGLTQSAKSSVTENIKTIDQLLNKQSVNGSDVLEIKKLLNEAWAPAKSIENSFNKRLLGVVHNELDSLAKKNPEWGKAWKNADELYKIQNWQTGLSRWASSSSGKSSLDKISANPLTIGFLTAMGGHMFGGYGLAGAAAPFALKQGIKGAHSGIKTAKFINSLSKTKDGQKLMWEIVANGAKNVGGMLNSNNALASSINKLNKSAKVFDKKQSTTSNVSKYGPVDMSKYKEVKFEDIPF